VLGGAAEGAAGRPSRDAAAAAHRKVHWSEKFRSSLSKNSRPPFIFGSRRRRACFTWSNSLAKLRGMSETVNIHEAKTRLSSLVARAEAGEEIIIARANRPVVRLVPVKETRAPRRLGEAKGMVEILPDFDELPDDFMEHFR
jgi:prevent-host-death family protein